MQVEAEKLYNDQLTQELVAEALISGKKVIFRFVNDEQKAEFMDEVGKIGAAAGKCMATAAIASLGIAMTAEAMTFGTATIVLLVVAALLPLASYALGAWLAHFIYGIAGKNGKIEIEEAWDWFGFRKGRVAVRALSPA